MRFDQLVNSILNESTIPRVNIHDPKVIYLAVTSDGNWLGKMMGYNEQDMFAIFSQDIEDFTVSNFREAERIFLEGIYHREGSLTDSEEATQNFYKRFTQLIEPYKDVHGQWFAGELDSDAFILCVKIDHHYYRTGGLQAVAGDDTTEEEGSIMDL